MLDVLAYRRPWRSDIELLFKFDDHRGRHVAQPLVMALEPEGQISQPTVVLPNKDAQDLMDELWRCGLRPSEGTGSAGSLAATEKHLKDMQTVAMGLLRKSGVQL